ncbi:Transposase DDE domain protein [compost metagenome]
MSLFTHLSLVEDTRSHINQRHDLVDILFLVLSAVASGQNGWSEIQQFGELRIDWLKKFRAFSNGIPRRHTICRIMQAINPASFQLCLYNWINDIRKESDKPLLAIDGKTLKGASKSGYKTLHSVSAYDLNNGLSLYQEMAAGKGKEIETVQSLISVLNIDNALLTLDALHAQKKTLEGIIARNGDYLVQIKANQRQLFSSVKMQFDDAFKDESTLARFETLNQAHGRTEQRITFQISANFCPELKEKWPSVKTLVAVERHRKDKRTNTLDTAFYLSSHEISPEFIGTSVREHWLIENSLHWVLDVVYHEDECRVHNSNAAESLAIMRRLAFNLARQETTQNRSMKSKVQRALLSDEYRELMIFSDVKSN